MPAEPAAPPRPGRGWSVRSRVLALVLAFIVLGLAVAGAVTFTVQFAAVEDRIEADLRQEIEELEQLALSGPDGDGEPYQDLDELFVAYLQTSVPNEHESMVTLVDDEVDYVPGGARPFQLERPEVLQVVRAVRVEAATTYARMALDGHDLRLTVASVSLAGDDRSGTLVVGVDAAPVRDQVEGSIRTYLLVAAVTLVVTATVAHVVTGRLLRPLTDLGQATAAIDPDDLTHRVPVSETDTDVARLAAAFNRMLDRLEAGFVEQRQFLDDAAHELRTPLTIIRGNLELLEAGDPEDVAQTRALVLEEMDRMQRLVDDLLLLAKSQRPDFVRPAELDVATLTDELLDRVRLLGDREWRVAARADGAGAAGPTVRADRQRLQQAVVQLAANAVKFSDPGTPVTLATAWSPPDAQVRAQLAEPASRYLVVSVEDQGVGLEPDQVDRVFERFSRLEQARPVEGSGLGLSIVLAIARAHGGTVTVDSVPGVGSTFRLWLPAPGG
ncbi:sensor histidine kinase [Ornithinicoccus halotolerans]|uniref:sensor histidine kinase n=1 Tax=Ornithinicoccus halotolerans TaxID=1748220 RepID=UPI001294CB77|nr:HAMP domain-containing sensor histidine kinase [Ornithinicoccus halotolerans]